MTGFFARGGFSLEGEIQLPPGLVDRDGNGVGEIQAATVGPHRQTQSLFVGQRIADLGRQASAFRPEKKSIATLELHFMERLRALGGERKEARLANALQATVQIGVTLERRVLVVIQARAAQTLVVQLEAQRLNQVQATAGVGAEPDNVAGIRRDFRLKKDYMKHARHRL